MAGISTYIAAIEAAARGEEVRDSIVDALEAINAGVDNALTVNGHTVGVDVPATAVFLTQAEKSQLDTVPVPTIADAGKFLRVDSTGAWALESVADAEEVGF